MTQKTKLPEQTMQELLRKWAEIGLLVGGFIVYTAIIGMVETFHSRELVDGALGDTDVVFTLGQLLIFMPGIVAGYLIALKQKDPVKKLISGATIGLVSIIPVVILLLIAEALPDIRDMLVNLNSNMVEILTFESETMAAGLPTIMLVLFGSAMFGMLLTFIPNQFRRVLVSALSITVLSAMLGEMLFQVLNQFVERSVLRPYLNRGTFTAVGIIIAFFFWGGVSLFWMFIGRDLQKRYQALAAADETKIKNSDMPPVTRTAILVTPYIILIIFLFLIPQITGSFLSQVMFLVGLYVLMGLGLNMAVGLAGLLDLGYVTNYAVGAYIAAYLTSTGPLGFAANGGIEMTIWMVLPIALIAAMLTGFLFALPVLRMRGDYLAIATLGFGEIIGRLAVSDWFKPVIGGAQGLKQIANPPFFGTTFSEPEQFYYIVLVICIIMVFVSIRLNNSRIGRQWMAIREDEDAASAMGINTARAKLLAFTLSAAIGGVAGAVFASRVGAVFPNSFTLFVSLNVLSIIIVGGMGSIPGIVLGSFFLIGMPEILREFSEYRFLIYGVLLVVMMLVRPEGLWPSSVRRREMRGDDDPDPALQNFDNVENVPIA